MAALPGSGAMKALRMSQLLKPCSLLKALEAGASYLGQVYIIKVLHSLEEDGLLDLADYVHLFWAHYVFLPRLAEALHTFTEGWDNHPLRSEGGLSPNQLWIMGRMRNPPDPNYDLQNVELLRTVWEMFDAVPEEPYGVQVLEID